LNEFLRALIAKYRNRGLLIDSNLLILYIVGEFDPARISTFVRTKKFTVEDYYWIRAIMGCFSKKVTTPNILTEISNLSGKFDAGLRAEFFHKLRTHFQVLDETHLPSREAAASRIFARLGLTDTVISEVAKQKYLVLTDDFPLANYLVSIKADVINFNHYRSLS
jgi:rRNA-processing protein FCF1